MWTRIWSRFNLMSKSIQMSRDKQYTHNMAISKVIGLFKNQEVNSENITRY
jgi:hypothetical protein